MGCLWWTATVGLNGGGNEIEGMGRQRGILEDRFVILPHLFFPRPSRSVRRCRRGQDRVDHGADQQRGQGPRWLLCVRRGGGAHPRGKRLVPRDDRVRSHQPQGRHLQGTRSGQERVKSGKTQHYGCVCGPLCECFYSWYVTRVHSWLNCPSPS